LKKEAEDNTEKLVSEKHNNRFNYEASTARVKCETNYREGGRDFVHESKSSGNNDVVDGAKNKKIKRAKIKIPKFETNDSDVGHENFFIKNLRKTDS
jgi:hypothetical protein